MQRESKMTKQEIAEALEIPWDKLVEWSKDPTFLQDILTLALHKGFLYGQTKTNEAYNQAFRGYDEVTIKN
jgi:hypothetical protein